jgi:hypothetical protein
MDEHVWIPAILVNKRVPWSAHGQPMVSPPCCVSGARWGRRTHLRVPSRSGRGISFCTGAELGLGPLGFLDPWETVPSVCMSWICPQNDCSRAFVGIPSRSSWISWAPEVEDEGEARLRWRQPISPLDSQGQILGWGMVIHCFKG